MPKQTQLLNNLEKVVLSNFVDTSVYFWVAGIRSIMPTVTVEQAIDLFIRKNNIYNYDSEDLRVRFHQMQKKIYTNGTPSKL